MVSLQSLQVYNVILTTLFIDSLVLVGLDTEVILILRFIIKEHKIQ